MPDEAKAVNANAVPPRPAVPHSLTHEPIEAHHARMARKREEDQLYRGFLARLNAGESFQTLCNEIVDNAELDDIWFPLTDRLRKTAARRFKPGSAERQAINHHRHRSMMLNRLVRKCGSRKALTFEYIDDLWREQDRKCALTGLIMTLNWEPGKYQPLNASIDCVIPKAKPGSLGYLPGNVQLVCDFANQLRGAMTVEQFKAGWQQIAKAMCASSTSPCCERPPEIGGNPDANL